MLPLGFRLDVEAVAAEFRRLLLLDVPEVTELLAGMGLAFDDVAEASMGMVEAVQPCGRMVAVWDLPEEDLTDSEKELLESLLNWTEFVYVHGALAAAMTLRGEGRGSMRALTEARDQLYAVIGEHGLGNVEPLADTAGFPIEEAQRAMADVLGEPDVRALVGPPFIDPRLREEWERDTGRVAALAAVIGGRSFVPESGAA